MDRKGILGGAILSAAHAHHYCKTHVTLSLSIDNLLFWPENLPMVQLTSKFTNKRMLHVVPREILKMTHVLGSCDTRNTLLTSDY